MPLDILRCNSRNCGKEYYMIVRYNTLSIYLCLFFILDDILYKRERERVRE